MKIKTVNSNCIGAYRCKVKITLSARVRNLILALSGVIVGALTGLLGGGGGSVVVPLYSSYGLAQKNSHATAIATILPLSLVSGIIYGMRGNYPYKTALWVTGGVAVGGLVGAWLLKRINPTVLSLLFYGIMVYAGIKMLL